MRTAKQKQAARREGSRRSGSAASAGASLAHGCRLLALLQEGLKGRCVGAVGACGHALVLGLACPCASQGLGSASVATLRQQRGAGGFWSGRQAGRKGACCHAGTIRHQSRPELAGTRQRRPWPSAPRADLARLHLALQLGIVHLAAAALEQHAAHGCLLLRLLLLPGLHALHAVGGRARHRVDVCGGWWGEGAVSGSAVGRVSSQHLGDAAAQHAPLTLVCSGGRAAHPHPPACPAPTPSACPTH